MAQAGYTPIQLYYSATSTNAPSAGNLVAGELAINTADGKLFYKDSSNAVQVIAWKTTPTSAGGTGLTTFTANGVMYASSSSALATSSALTFDGTNFASTGNITSGGILQALGTVQSSSGADLSLNANGSNRDVFLKVNGTTLMTVQGSTANVGVGTSSPTSGIQTAGSSSKSAFKTPNIAEVDTISATAATGTINYDITTQSVLFYTSNASANWTVNFRGSSGTSLNTVMQTGESISATFLVTQGATAYYNSAVTIDGTSVTPKWQGGTAPTSGNASSVDCYTYVIQKTGSATYAVLASQTKFA